MGDSKTNGEAWVWMLNGELNKRTGYSWAEIKPQFGISGYSTASMKTYVDANLAAVTGIADIITLNLGANDASAMPLQATWQANTTSIIDSFRAKWPSVKIYLAHTWRRSYATESNTLATWRSAVVATYASGVYIGMDERGWLEGGDDGATMTVDGTHYSVAAEIVAAAQWITGFGL